jgi:hypothetical protein
LFDEFLARINKYELRAGRPERCPIEQKPEGIGKKSAVDYLKHYSGICLGGPRKITMTLSQDGRPGTDVKPKPPNRNLGRYRCANPLGTEPFVYAYVKLSLCLII